MSGKSYDTYNGVKVVCPFYKGAEPLDIRCEGIDPNGAVVNHFPHPTRKARYMHAYCESLQGCQGCLIYRLTMTKYP